MFFTKGSKHRNKKSDDIKKKNSELLDDDFFSVDNGLSRIEISGLGIKESRAIPSSAEKNALAAGKNGEARSILTDSGAAESDKPREGDPFFVLGSNKRARPAEQAQTAQSRRPVSFYYGIDTTDTEPEAKAEEPAFASEVFTHEAPASRAVDTGSADSVFGADFDPFRLAMSEELAYKPSSRSKSEEKPRVSERLSEITEEDVIRARRLADEELKRKKKQEEFERKKSEYFASIRKPEQKPTEPEAPASAPEQVLIKEETPSVTHVSLDSAASKEESREDTPRVVHIEFGSADSGADKPATEYTPAPNPAAETEPERTVTEAQKSPYSFNPYANMTAQVRSEAQPRRATDGSSYRRAAEFARAALLDTAPNAEPIAPPAYDYRPTEPVEPTYTYRHKETEEAPTYSFNNEEPTAYGYGSAPVTEPSYNTEEPKETAAPEYSFEGEAPDAPDYGDSDKPEAPIFKEFPSIDPSGEPESGLIFEINENIPAPAPRPQPATIATERTLFGFGSDDDEDGEPYVTDAIDTEDEDGEDISEVQSDDDSSDGDGVWNDDEIPPENQNPDVIRMRGSFSALDEDEPQVGDEPDTPSEPTDEYGEDEYKEDGEPLDSDEAAGEYDEPDCDAKVEDVPFDMPVKRAAEPPKEEKKPAEKKKIDYSYYIPPPIELLGLDEELDDGEIAAEIQENTKTIIETLASFHVTASIKGVDRGPRITRYEVVPAKGVKVNQITNLFDDITLYLAADGIRMEAPIPGKSAIGFEIPNKRSANVRLRELLECDEFVNAKSNTFVCIGKDVAGNPVFGDIGKFPHALIAGATGMGKSVAINAIMISMLYKARPDQVKFIMIDPKKVEFKMYSGIPHLLIPVITESKQAAGALMWAVEEMERRYDLIEKLNIRNIDAYNEKQLRDPSIGEYMPKIIVVIDELNDLMMQVRDPVEDLIMRIAQKARAAGIHLIIGTQRPDVKVITGTIKANINTRLSCKVTSVVDSRTILEMAGAEKLLNRGDMLFKPVDKTKPVRVQGAFVSDSEVEDIMDFLKSQTPDAQYDDEIFAEINKAAQKCGNKKGSSQNLDDEGGDDGAACGYYGDQQFLDAVELAIRLRKVATSLLQRKMSIGYSKAAKFIDCMEEIGVVGPPNGSKPRDVLITLDEWYEKLSRVGND